MFDFLFRRRKSAAITGAAVPVPAIPVVSVAASQRQHALEQAAALGTDEQAAVAFILDCSVAEARLQAAQLLLTRAALVQVQKAMRDTDRRVAKLLQQRLDAMLQQDLIQQKAQAIIARAQALCVETALRANQVVDLEAAWQLLDAGPQTQSAFAGLRETLDRSLQAQADLQRRVLDATASLRAMLAEPVIGIEAAGPVAETVDRILTQAQQDVELPSLPKQLLPELGRLRTQLPQLRTQAIDQSALMVREQALAAWQVQAADTATEVPAESVEPVSVPPRETRETLQRAWRVLPPVADAARMQALQERFDSLLLQFAPSPVAVVKAVARTRPAASISDAVTAADIQQQRSQFAAALAGLQAALEEGALQRAMEQDRVLRSLDIEIVRLTIDQQSGLASVRAELAHLQGWARWGGTVSREELLVAVVALAQQELAVAELAKKVGSMRERWRALDASAGAAPRALWLRFDAACTTAYAPVAAHFAVLAHERAINADKAQGLLDEVTAFATATMLPKAQEVVAGQSMAAPDWRAIAAFCQRMRQAWQGLGPIERKEQKRLDAAFTQAMLPLDAPLAAQQTHEVCQRQLLIDEVALLSPQARDTPEHLQALQLRWQQHAKSLPLPRQQEQLLWQQFRAACDAIFAQRKTAGAAADAQRIASQQVKADLCQALEDAAVVGGLSDMQQTSLLRQSRAAWEAAGPVARAMQVQLQSRFDAAIGALEAQRVAVVRAAIAEKYGAVQAKLQLCQQQEQQLVAALPAVPELDSQWAQLAALPEALERVLRARFDAATRALDAADGQYAVLLEQNQTARDAALLRLEVACTIASPPAFQRERLALQVAGLQSTFKAGASGSAGGTDKSELTALCAMPAIADDLAQSRIRKVVAALVAAA